MAKEVFTFDFCGRNLTIETGEIAKQAGGAVVVRYQDTVVLSTATANHTPKDSDFFPLTVSFEEKLYSVCLLYTSNASRSFTRCLWRRWIKRSREIL